MQAIFKNPEELILNGADNNERALLNSFIEASKDENTKIETSALYDINANVSGMSAKLVKHVLPKIQYFEEPIKVEEDATVIKTIKTDPANCTIYINSVANNFEVNTVGIDQLEIIGKTVGTEILEAYIYKEGYETLKVEIPVEVIEKEPEPYVLELPDIAGLPEESVEYIINTPYIIKEARVLTVDDNICTITGSKESDTKYKFRYVFNSVGETSYGVWIIFDNDIEVSATAKVVVSNEDTAENK